MNRRSFLATSASAGLAACATNASRSRGWALAGELDAAVARAMALNMTPGLAVAVYTRDGVYTRGFGVTDVSTNARADADTAFYIASSTKPLTSLALATLHQRGAFDLDSTLAAYAPDAPFPSAVGPDQTTFRQMLSHTSGIDNGPVGFRVAFSGQHDPETLWRLLAESTVNVEAPRGRFDYTNVGYNIATVLTDRRLGVAWQDILDREVFGPAGMTHASARISRAAAWSVAKPHALSGDGALSRIYLEKTDQTMQSAGGVIMSANDAARWLELMLAQGRVGGRQVISPDVIEAVKTPIAGVQAELDGYMREAYALGWYHGPYRDQRLLHHFGGFAGFRAHVSFMPAVGVGVAVFANGNQGGAVTDCIANYVYDRVLGANDSTQRFDAALADGAEQRARSISAINGGIASRASRPWTLTRPRTAYAGVYESDAWGSIEVATEGDALRLRYGAMQATAEPFTQPNSLRVEFVPGQGEPVLFEGDGELPEALRTRAASFLRV